jgi:hypothetical protein
MILRDHRFGLAEVLDLAAPAGTAVASSSSRDASSSAGRSGEGRRDLGDVDCVEVGRVAGDHVGRVEGGLVAVVEFRRYSRT